MWFLAFLLGLAPGSPRAGAGRSCRRPARRNPAACRLHAEPLEARCCPSASYTLTDLGTLGGPSSYAYAINSAGQVVGDSGDGSPDYGRAFLWTQGATDGVPSNPQMKNLGSLGGKGNTQPWPGSEGLGINDASQVVGEANTASGASHAFLWTPGGTDGVTGNPQMKDLGTLPGDTNSIAYGINPTSSDGVQVVGESDSASGQQHAFLWTQNGGMISLGTGTAFAINDAGQVVGGHYSGGDAFLWQNGKMYDLGTLGGGSSFARAINAKGQVAGQSYLKNGSSEYDAFLWTPTTNNGTTGNMKDLGTLKSTNKNDSAAYGINDSGAVVGNSGEGPATGPGAFYWPGSHSLQNLNDLVPAGSMFLEIAAGINDGGQIAGWDYAGGSAWLLTPPTGGQAPMAAAIRSRAATDTGTGSIAGGHTGTVVRPAAAVRFILSAPSSVMHGVAFRLTLTVHDVNGHVATGYTGTVHFSRSDSTATLPKNYTFTASDAGVHTFTGVILRKKGKQTITVIDALNSALTATDSISVV
jgi:probable HAF family extracellular repeat protein